MHINTHFHVFAQPTQNVWCISSYNSIQLQVINWLFSKDIRDATIVSVCMSKHMTITQTFYIKLIQRFYIKLIQRLESSPNIYTFDLNIKVSCSLVNVSYNAPLLMLKSFIQQRFEASSCT